MAKILPEVFPGRPDSSDPEYLVYQALRKLSDAYVVFYSKRLKAVRGAKDECEIDFIIFNQKDVLLCLEVKGGLVSYDGAQDRWKQNGSVMMRAPDRQATAATHCLIAALGADVKNINVDWALCFPQCITVPMDPSASIPRSRIVDEKQLLDLGECIRSLEHEVRSQFGKRGAPPSEANRLVQRLTRNLGFVQILGVRIARESEQLLEVTQEQCEVLTDLAVNTRMVVHGAAGTGKTVLAQEFAKRLEAEGKRVLLLFFNKAIASKVRSAFPRESNVIVSTFSSFAKRLVEQHDPVWWDAQDHIGDFWTLELPAHLFDLPKEFQPTFDAIVVDEGQDFKPEWYEYLNTLLADGRGSHFAVFLDEHQDIFGHWKCFPCVPAPAKKVLTKNCRNTRTIVDHLSKAYPVRMTCFDRSPVGTPILEREVLGRVDEQTQIIRDIKRLIEVEQINPGSIVILIPGLKSESSLADTKKIAGFPLESTYGRYDPRAKCVYYATIDIFKGLEADVVMLILGARSRTSDEGRSLYVEGSRAKHVLFVYREAPVLILSEGPI